MPSRRSARLRRLATAAAAVLLPLLGTRVEAYPQFQLSTGAARCNQCHIAPAGGGLLNDYGRFAAESEISPRGDGDLLHGLWEPPDWLDLGGDLRQALIVNDVGASTGAEVATFPMQADLYVRLATGPWSANAVGGVRGAARPRDPSLASRLVSREHYLMWQPKTRGPYLRAGRFFAPFGLRNVEHPSFVRRFLGFHVLEETYNVSGGVVENDWELHATAFTEPPFQSAAQLGSGGAVFYERRVLDRAAVVGAQARVATREGDVATTVGGIGKYFHEGSSVLLMGEVDASHRSIELGGGEAHQQLALTSHLSASWLPTVGWMLSLAWERHDAELRVADTGRNAVVSQVHWFPTAHVELMLYGRALVAGESGDAATGLLAMLQAHYYF